MKVIITESAKNSLGEIYQYKSDYSIDHADNFYDEIINFTINNLSSFPELGHLYNESKGLYRLIYEKRYNIYYIIENKNVFVLYIIDGSIEMNQTLKK